MEYADDTGADIDCPIVGYRFQGREMRQACEFNLRHHELGHVVPILIHPESGEIFITASHDRWTLSGVLLGCLVFLGLLAALSN